MAIKLTHMESIVLHQLVEMQYNFHHSASLSFCVYLYSVSAHCNRRWRFWPFFNWRCCFYCVDLLNLAPWHRTIILKTISTFTFFFLSLEMRCQRKWHMCCAHHIDHLEFASAIIHCFFFLYMLETSWQLWTSLVMAFIAILLLIGLICGIRLVRLIDLKIRLWQMHPFNKHKHNHVRPHNIPFQMKITIIMISFSFLVFHVVVRTMENGQNKLLAIKCKME